jgi:hypothetical protein
MDKEYKSSANSFQEFIDSSIWKDMTYELNIWLEGIRDALESKEKTPDLETLKELQGGADIIRRVLLMPSVLRDNIIEDNERKETNND